MKYIIFVRHGDYEHRGTESRVYPLSSEGENQMRALAEKLKDKFHGQEFELLSSNYKRTEQSSNIILDILGLGSYTKSWTLASRSFNIPSAIRCIQDNDKGTGSVMIVVTHKDVMVHLINTWGSKHFGKQVSFPVPGIGGAIIIDCETQERNIIGPS